MRSEMMAKNVFYTFVCFTYYHYYEITFRYSGEIVTAIKDAATSGVVSGSYIFEFKFDFASGFKKR